MEEIVPIISVTSLTHNVRQIRVEKPEGFSFEPGQATEVSINQPEWIKERRPFTFTCLTEDPYLEFVIKIYSDHDGVTNQIGQLKPGDELIIREAWGAIQYQSPGYFIAGGAGITPFIAILRDLQKKKLLEENRLFFCNRTAHDIILEKELKNMLGNNVIFITTRDAVPEFEHGRINEEFLRDHILDFNKQFYICGPEPMVQELNEILIRSGAQPETIVFEK
jgi:hypothetical protein